MKTAQIEVGKKYTAKVSENIVTVQVDSITEDRNGKTVFYVTNLSTRRKLIFRSAQKFRTEVKPLTARPGTAIGRVITPEASAVVIPPGERGGQYRSPPPTEVDTPDIVAARAKAEPKPVTPQVPAIPGMSALGASLAANSASRTSKAPHLIVKARAGTGKTTTLVEGMRLIKGLSSSLIPSPQQAAVWDAMKLSKGEASTVLFCAFNKSIALELQKRLAPIGCEASTIHSMGYKAVTKAFGRMDVSDWNVKNITCELLGKEYKDIMSTSPAILFAVDDLVKAVKVNLTDTSTATLDRLAAHYDVDLDKYRETVYDLVAQVIEICKTRPATERKMDFNDQIWLPVVLGLPVYKYDILLVDEAQDLNRCQQALAKMAGRRLILCGDDRQAIYGFAGADAESLPRMLQELSETSQGCVELPLTVTRRCGRAIVTEAQQYVSDFEAHESNGEGRVDRASFGDKGRIGEGSYHAGVADGDMILCRINAPLVSQCFAFLRAGRKANIQGREVGKGLISTIERMKAESVADLIDKLEKWHTSECDKENAKKNPSEARLQGIEDRYLCLVMFTEDKATVEEVKTSIKNIFSDDKGDGVKLSSIHRAKGLEARTVWLLQPEGATIPHKMAKTAWAKHQEYNLLYVAVTRAIERLVHVA